MLEDSFEEAIDLLGRTREMHKETIENIAQHVLTCYKQGKMPILFGNGGSFSDTEHFAAEFIGAYKNRERSPLPAITLSNLAALTALANDFDYKYTFKKLVETFAQFSSIAIGFSTSGTSMNVVYGLEEARKRGLYTVGFTGLTGGKVKDYTDILFNVPSENTPRIQEVHHFAYHEICGIVEHALFG